MSDSDYYNMIFKRKSFHLFRNIGEEKISPSELSEIECAYKEFTPLISDIKTKIKIIPGYQTNVKRGEEYCIYLYSEKKNDYLKNIGYLGEQLDLFLTSENIGVLWYGIGKTDELYYENLNFVIMLAISKIDGEEKFRKDMFKSKRKSVKEIWSGNLIEGVTNIVRFAPSACNTQPWFVEHIGNQIKIYRYKKNGKRGIMPAAKVTYYNQIDMGIFLLFLDICLSHNKILADKEIITDNGSDAEMTLIAIYNIIYK